MTISTTASRISYNGNGVTTIFAIPFRFFANTDLVVQLVTISTGASSTLTLTTNYTVTGADDEDGGSLTMVVAPAVGQRLVIRRVIAATQEVDYVAGDPFPAETHERALDRLTMLAQQGEEVNARALVLPSGDTASGNLPNVAARANRLLGFDSLGNPAAVAPVEGTATALATALAASGGAALVGHGSGTVAGALNYDAGFIATGGNDSAALQTFINANRGRRLVVRGQCRFSGVTMVGATYNGTQIHFEHAFLLPAPAQFTNNFNSVWCGIGFQEVDSPVITGFFNGNRSAQQARQQTINIAIAGCTSVRIPEAVFTEVRGDGIYIGQSNFIASSTNTNGVHMGTIIGWNSAPGDGRNLVSHVSGDNVTCDSFTSIDIGGIIAGLVMPGGWDTEPDHPYQSCNNVQLGRVFVRHRGTCGLAFQGRLESKNTRNVTVGVAHVINDCPANLLDQSSNLTITDNQTLLVKSVDGFACENHRGEFLNAYGAGCIVTDSDNVHLTTRVKRTREGVIVGRDDRDASGPGVRNSVIKVHVESTCRYGVVTGKLSDVKLSGKVQDVVTGFYSGSLFGVIGVEGYTQTNVSYSIDVKASTNWTRSYRNDATTPITFVNCVIENCDLSGTWGGYTNQVGDMRIIRRNVRGVTDQPSTPSVGTLWLAGQRIENNSGVVGQPRGWTISSTNTLVSWGNL